MIADDRVKIRMAQLSDANAIAQLSRQLDCFLEPQAVADKLEVMLEDQLHVIFVADSMNRVIGWVHGFMIIRIEAASSAEIGALVVDRPHRGVGVATQLFKQIKTWAIQQDCARLRVRCAEKRTNAHEFYKKQGMVIIKTQNIFDTQLR